MKLSGHTTPFAVLGHPIGHTLSPVMHNAAIAELGMDAIYLAFDVSPERLMDVLGAMKDMGFAGVNLTVPLKEVALRGLSELDDSARLLGAVNTVHFSNEGAIGYNTDGDGFLKAFEEAFGRDIAGSSVCVLGTGGAGRAVALVCARDGASSLLLFDVDVARAGTLANELATQGGGATVEVLDDAANLASVAQQADVVIHATPVGMKEGDVSIVGSDAFRDGQCVFDLIYHVPETVVMKAAAAGGAATANGLGMLLHQGARALEIWTGREAPVATMRTALEEAVYGP